MTTTITVAEGLTITKRVINGFVLLTAEKTKK